MTEGNSSRSFKFRIIFFQLIAATCLFMAGKLRNTDVKIRDIINVSNCTLFRGSEPLDLTDKYWAMRDAIVQAELLIMRMIKFQLSIPDPFKVGCTFFRILISAM